MEPMSPALAADSPPLDYHRKCGKSTAFLLKLIFLLGALVGAGGRGMSKYILFLLRVKEKEGCVCVRVCMHTLSSSLRGALLEPMSLGPQPSIAMTTASMRT